MFRSTLLTKNACTLLTRSAFNNARGSVAFKYSDIVIDHYENPRNVGKQENPRN